MYDNGNEFLGSGFQNTLRKHAIKAVPTAVKNPQSNAICERMHKTILDVLRVYMRTQKMETYKDATHIMDCALAAMQHATRCAVHKTLQHSPGKIVFHRDMFVDVPVMTDLIALRERRQLLIDKNLQRHNRKQYNHHYRVNNWVMIKKYDPWKGDDRLHGPYQITEVRTNGTVQIQQDVRGKIEETFNICRLVPYKGPPTEECTTKERTNIVHHFI